MIRLTRLNGKPFVLNAELIQTLDETPDTVITMVDGKKFIVAENLEEVIRLVLEFRRLCRMVPSD